MLAILDQINQILWGFPLLLLLGGAHLYFTLKLKFPQKYTLKAIRLSVTPEKEGDSKNLSGFAALATTLAATLGTGNIIGVSAAIAAGGPGALFWCWLTGILGMATCYAECFLSVLFRSRKKDGTYTGGPMYVLENGLHSKPLGKVYAGCALLAAFGVGCTTQASAITEAVRTVVPVSPHLIGILAAFTAGLVILGGVRSIGTFCSRMVPALGFFYIGCCLYLLFLNKDYLPATFSLILESAFSPRAAAGGFAGSTLLHAARYGIARGLFTNEAESEPLPVAAASSSTQDPRRQGLCIHDGRILGYRGHVRRNRSGHYQQHPKASLFHPRLQFLQPHFPPPLPSCPSAVPPCFPSPWSLLRSPRSSAGAIMEKEPPSIYSAWEASFPTTCAISL